MKFLPNLIISESVAHMLHIICIHVLCGFTLVLQARVLEYMLYLLPFQIPDFIEAVELLQTKLLVLLLGVFVQSLEDAHHLPLSCNDNSDEITCPVAIYFSVVICRVSDACIQRIHYKLGATFSDKYR